MELSSTVAIVTGAGGGIGSALGTALAARGTRVVLADLNERSVQTVAERVDARYPGHAVGVGADVSATSEIRRVLALAEHRFGPVDLYFANAGIIGGQGIGDREEDWDRILDVNLRAHIRAAKLLIPHWIKRGSGYFVATASAAGLLTQLGGAPYAVTKHAAVGFAEWLAITYGDQGVRVSCLCPMGVNTAMLHPGEKARDNLDRLGQQAVMSAGKVLEPAAVAEVVMQAIADECFLILPHPEVLEMYRHKGSDYDRWLNGMRRYQRKLNSVG